MMDGDARFLVELYLECRESKTLPFPGSLMNQTLFTVQLFDFLDRIIDEYRVKQQKEQVKELEKLKKKKGK